MWMDRLLIVDGQITDADCVRDGAINTTSRSILPPRALLAHIQADEDCDNRDAYRSLLCFALCLNNMHTSGVMNVLPPVLDLTLAEQALLRGCLIPQRDYLGATRQAPIQGFR